MENIKLSRSISSKGLTDYGFRTSNGKLFSLMRYLYSDTIYLRIMIKLDDKELEWEVIDKNSGSLYFPFYNNINRQNNLVALTVRDEFGKVIGEMKTKKIVRMDKDDGNGNQD